ncbi:MAG TPA: hypothetical protein VH054_04625 [Polyangiaceae bacterium]|jgi:hypothetical protein|nr:hypothetical protein [Polyangiaceae bacterium]
MRAFAFVLLLASCKPSAEHFSTRAEYEATRSGVRFVVYALGTTDSEEHVRFASPAVVVVCPLTNAGRPTRIDVASGDTNTPVMTTQQLGTLSWQSASRVGSLMSVLAAGSYPTPDATELTEIADAIDSVARGPSETRIAGQTHEVIASSVDFRTTDAPSFRDCAK